MYNLGLGPQSLLCLRLVHFRIRLDILQPSPGGLAGGTFIDILWQGQNAVFDSLATVMAKCGLARSLWVKCCHGWMDIALFHFLCLFWLNGGVDNRRWHSSSHKHNGHCWPCDKQVTDAAHWDAAWVDNERGDCIVTSVADPWFTGRGWTSLNFLKLSLSWINIQIHYKKA